MTSPTVRAAARREADTAIVLSVIHAKPKPEKRAKAKRTKRGICVNCGVIWKGIPEHTLDCPMELPLIKGTKYMSECNWLELALDEMCRLITIWRDGVPCVTPTSKCYGASTWSHVIPDGASPYLRHNLSNIFRQCQGDNGVHRFVQLPYFCYYEDTFGKAALRALKAEWQAHIGFKFSPAEMREQLLQYVSLYESRFIHGNSSLAEKVAAGFYGKIIQNVWVNEGRI